MEILGPRVLEVVMPNDFRFFGQYLLQHFTGNTAVMKIWIACVKAELYAVAHFFQQTEVFFVCQVGLNRENNTVVLSDLAGIAQMAHHIRVQFPVTDHGGPHYLRNTHLRSCLDGIRNAGLEQFA